MGERGERGESAEPDVFIVVFSSNWESGLTLNILAIGELDGDSGGVYDDFLEEVADDFVELGEGISTSNSEH